ncbi:hypothetical protein HK096_007641 [Nowakowskiella sp. JEL0078]|nr:hypothetical protein HK096_007641 [Nowakowskiella sp. JEL0078]
MHRRFRKVNHLDETIEVLQEKGEDGKYRNLAVDVNTTFVPKHKIRFIRDDFLNFDNLVYFFAIGCALLTYLQVNGIFVPSTELALALRGALGFGLAYLFSATSSTIWGRLINDAAKTTGIEPVTALHYTTANLKLWTRDIKVNSTVIACLLLQSLMFGSQTIVNTSLSFVDIAQTVRPTLNNTIQRIMPLGGCDSSGCITAATIYPGESWQYYTLHGYAPYVTNTLKAGSGNLAVPGWPEGLVTAIRTGKRDADISVIKAIATLIDVKCDIDNDIKVLSMTRGEYLSRNDSQVIVKGDVIGEAGNLMVSLGFALTGPSRIVAAACNATYVAGTGDFDWAILPEEVHVKGSNYQTLPNTTWNSDHGEIFHQLNFTVYQFLKYVAWTKILDDAIDGKDVNMAITIILTDLAYRLSTGTASTNQPLNSESSRQETRVTIVGLTDTAALAIVWGVPIAVLLLLLTRPFNRNWIEPEILQMINLFGHLLDRANGFCAPSWHRVLNPSKDVDVLIEPVSVSLTQKTMLYLENNADGGLSHLRLGVAPNLTTRLKDRHAGATTRSVAVGSEKLNSK